MTPPSPRTRSRLVYSLLTALLALAPASAAADVDRDGVADAVDNCPHVPNPGQQDRGGFASSAPDGVGDACQCGDVSADGSVRLDDALILKRARIGLPPGLAAPQLCNVIGPVDVRQTGAFGLPADCALNDLVTLERALLGAPPGISAVCAPTSPPALDTEAPEVEITSPPEGFVLPLGPADLAIAIRNDRSTGDRIGADLDGDGVSDRLLDAQVIAAGALLDTLDPTQTRVALITYSSVSNVAQPLTGDYDAVRTTLDEIRAQDPTRTGVTVSNALRRLREMLVGPASRAAAAPAAVLLAPVGSFISSFERDQLVAAGIAVYPLRIESDGVDPYAELAALTGGVSRAAPARGFPESLLDLPLPGPRLNVRAAARDRFGVAEVELTVTEVVAPDGPSPLLLSLPGPSVDRDPPYGASLAIAPTEPTPLRIEARAADFAGNATAAAPVQITATPGAGAPRILEVAPPSGGNVVDVTIRGRFFSARPAENRVTFAGVEGAVLEATKSELRVQVPDRLVSGSLLVEVGGRISNAVTFELDRDDDGLSDERELLLGTDPLLRDTDGDGLDDGLEVDTLGSSPLLLDSDGDGLSDGDEAAAGLDPADPADVALDPDRDGLSSLIEISGGTDHRRADSDGDGLIDGAEILFYGTDPLVADTDGGGRVDGLELREDATDPLDPADDISVVRGSVILVDGAGSVWQIERNGDLRQPGDVLRRGLQLDFVSGGSFPFLLDAFVEDGGREVRLGPIELDELTLTRKIFVPEDEAFARVLEIFENRGTLPKSFSFELETQLPTGRSLQATADGDLELETSDRWIVMGPIAYLTLGLFGPGGAPPELLTQLFSTTVRWRRTVMIPPGGRVIQMSFAARRGSLAEAQQAGADFDALSGRALDGLTRDELRSIVSYVAFADPDADGASDAEELAAGTNPLDPDSDGDGLLDGVELQAGLDPLTPGEAALDLDGDGIDNLTEQQLGSDLADPDSDGDGLRDADERARGTGLMMRDSDGDGLSDGEEALLAFTDPLDPDTDGDGLLDGDELVEHRSDPLALDTDGDGVADGAEVQHGFDPAAPEDGGSDLDNDGLSVVQELAAGSDPRDRDTDDDGIEDGEEVLELGTDPTAADTDGGGRRDRDEVESDATDPLDPADDLPVIPSFPVLLHDGDGFLWNITRHGQVLSGTSGAFLGFGLALSVSSSTFGTGFFQAQVSEDGGREVRLGPVTRGSLRVFRKVFVPEDDAFVRYLELLENPTESPETARLRLTTRLGSFTATEISATSSGDLVLSADDDYVVTDDGTVGARPLVSLLYAGEGGLEQPAVARLIAPDRIEVEYEVEVPAGGRVALLHFAVQSPDLASALDSVSSLRRLVAPSATSGLSAEEQADIVNFLGLSDRDGDGLADVDEAAAGTDPDTPDSDGDGLVDGVEVRHGLDPLDPGDGLEDLDADGLINPVELAHGTDLGSADSDGDGLGDGREVMFDGTDPLDPDSDGDGLDDGIEVKILGSDPRSPDSDGDGIPDGEEVNELGTSPTSTDSDGDGIPDGVEQGQFLDPADAADGAEDADGDGVDNGTEFQLGTGLRVPDSDGDGLEDGEEVELGTDPLAPDSDGGGRLDGEEVLTDATDPTDAADDLPAVSLPVELADGQGFLWEVRGDGSISRGTEGAFSSGMLLRELSSFDSERGFPTQLRALTEDGGRELHLGPAVPFRGSLLLERKIYVSPDDGFIRYLDFIENDRDFPRTARVRLATFTGPSSFSVGVFATSSGDSVVGLLDDWVVTGSTSPSTTIPFAAQVFAGANARARPQAVSRVGSRLRVDFTIEMQPRERVILMHFAVQARTPEEAAEAAPRLRSLLGNGLPDSALVGMSPEEQDAVVNVFGFRDADEDAVADSDELAAGTDPDSADTDGDGLPDGYELANGLDPLVDDASADPDGDGLSSAEERAAGTDPTGPDTDGDGLLDGDEGVRGTDPLAPDTDGDHLDDGDEVRSIGTDPLLADSDGDGIFDGEEVRDRTDPLASDSDGDGLSDGDEAASSALHPLDPSDAEADPDGDGLGSAEELALGTLPLLADTDRDGIEDGAELAVFGTDPTAPDTDGGGRGDGAELLVDATDPLNLGDDRIATSLPVVRDDGAGFEWRIERDATLAPNPSSLTFFSGLDLNLDGQRFPSFFEPGAARLEEGGAQLVIGPWVHADLIVTRKLLVSPDGGFVRYLDVLRNPTAAPIRTDLELVTPLSRFDEVLHSTSSGDTVLDAADDFAVFTTESSTHPFGLVFSGPHARLDLEVARIGREIIYEAPLTVPAGGRAIAMHFVVRADTAAETGQLAAELHALPPAALLGLVPAEQADVLTFFAFADDDADGLSNADEAALGTDPTDPDSDGDGAFDGFESRFGLDPLDPADAAEDPDGDGLDSAGEHAAGSSPLDPDSDGDGIEDGAEVAAGSDPTRTDSDGDGLLDGAELAAGSDPARPDTDGDGAGDGLEVSLGTDPTRSDSDGDGLGDGTELDAGLDALDPGDASRDHDEDGLTSAEELALGTQPFLADSDLDGIQDGDELALGTDPARVDSDGGGREDGEELRSDGTDPLVASDDLETETLPTERFDAEGYVWDIQRRGNVLDGTQDAFDSALDLFISGSGGLPEGIPLQSRAVVDASTGELRLGPAQVGGIELTRRILVPPDATFARYVEVLENPGAEERVVRVSLSSRFDPPGFVFTSSGDDVADAGDRFIVHDDDVDLGQDPAVALVFAGRRGQAPASVTLDEGHLTAEFDVRIPPGGRRLVLHFAVQSFGRLLALLRAMELESIGESALRGLTPEDRAQVVNFFAFPDADGDGLSDDDEAALGTDPAEPDSDGDGLLDGFEVAHGLDPLAPGDASADSDLDGLDNAAEQAGGTDPRDPDSDGDGLVDGDEQAAGTDPLDPDSDGDGLLDGDEVARGTSPLAGDSDGDGLSDRIEVELHGTDPTQLDSDGDAIADDVEIAAGLDPLDPLDAGDDLDGDGLTNAEELLLGTDLSRDDTDGDALTDGDELAVHGTDPLVSDTDGSGRKDGQELLIDGTDPLDAADEIEFVPLEHTLRDGSGRIWTVDRSGSANGIGFLRVNSFSFGSAPSTALRDVSGRELLLGPERVDGLLLTRRVRVSGAEGFVRFVEVIDNPGAEDATATVSLSDSFFQAPAAAILVTSSGRPLGPQDDYYVLEARSSRGARGAAHVFSGRGSVLEPDSASRFDGGFLAVSVSIRFEVSVPAGGRVALMHFGADPLSLESGIETAERLRALLDGARDGLSAPLLDVIANFGAPDSDLDGLDDETEAVLGTDPLEADSDGDGLLDGFELTHALDPLLPGQEHDDPDADGLDHLAEQSARTDPLDPDSDADGIDDGTELALLGTDPLSPDSDADGLPDGRELDVGTDPLDPDTDGGGQLDAEELDLDGTDPLDPADDWSRVTLPVDLTDGAGVAWSLGPSGVVSLSGGLGTVALADTRIEGVPAPQRLAVARAPGGERIRFGPYEASGLRVTRLLDVAPGRPFLRVLDSYANPTTETAEVSVAIISNVVGQIAIRPEGGPELTPLDQYVVSTSGGGIAEVVHRGGLRPEVQELSIELFPGFRISAYAHVWRVSIPPGERLTMVRFLIHAPSPAAAAGRAEAILSSGDAGLEGLEPDAEEALFNFEISP